MCRQQLSLALIALVLIATGELVLRSLEPYLAR